MNRTALSLAVELGCVEIVQLLLEHKDIDVNIKYKISIHTFHFVLMSIVFIKFHFFVLNDEILKYFIYEIHFRFYYKTILNLAIEHGNKEIIRLLLCQNKIFELPVL